jgi:hypothetical protein
MFWRSKLQAMVIGKKKCLPILLSRLVAEVISDDIGLTFEKAELSSSAEPQRVVAQKIRR